MSATNSTVTPSSQASQDSASYYNGLVPSLAYNVAMLVIWSVLLTIHVLQLYLKQYWFSTGFICTGILEVLGYIGRTWSHFNQDNLNAFLLNMVCLTISPVFTLGSLYYQLSKLIEIYGHSFALLHPSICYAHIFICCDIISLAVQASGGGVAGTESGEGKSPRQGTHVFVGGLAFQVASLSIFIILMAHFVFKVYIQTRWRYMGYMSFKPSIFKISQRDLEPMYSEKYQSLRIMPDRWVFRYFIHALIVTVLLVFVRCAYRLSELANGWSGYLAVHETYFIILDGVMMSLGATIMTVFHPGFAFKGRFVSIPITNAKKLGSNNDSPNIPQPESEQEEDTATASEDEKYYTNEPTSPTTGRPKRAFSLPSFGSGPTLTSLIGPSLKRVSNPFGSRGGTKKTYKEGLESDLEESSGVPHQNALVEEPPFRDSADVPDPHEPATHRVV
ncbi:ZYRO0B15686p [Zygosaccharomyces rouxii]|uniref:Sphingoid long-chain base transporter RSB1 n=1 Tax=Zygosaccharomyces rouxii (strain ATCC 2623 / CBS 732 / NBRC 1130 / NCYC 568 / NRRL Y-229) TaxID=559307 RepID=C5DSC2_ZYGRC|nr:uncharacterized protein ZYRO0B15686g [Zygosaccharomyces rouxii]KAH9199786.1 RTA1 like protein-domain-containing protein [Zygosaccharomyces rouxii]CAR26683.1 ZYRO0B15686p [Zygosaccharomyces rouxii]